ncbi:MAG: glycosyltransferase family 39 protein [Candidatus Woykebacteria bacterium]
MRKFFRSEINVLVTLFIANLAIKFLRLTSPSDVYFDEGAYYIPTARSFLAGNFEANFEHPPLAKLFMAAGIKIFGDNPWGWRIPEVLVGSLGVIFIYLLAKKMFGGRLIPTLSALFLTFEFSWFVNSRVAVPEIYVATFSLAATLFFWSFFKEEKARYLGLAGIFFGLSIASKWNGLFLLAFGSCFYLWKKRATPLKSLPKLGLLFLIVGVVYLGSYSFYLLNHSLPDLINLHAKMFDYHTGGVFEKVEQKQEINNLVFHLTPMTWLLNPLYSYIGRQEYGSVQAIFFMFNPALFWGSIVLILKGAKDLVFHRTRSLVTSEKTFLIGAFLTFWLPWFFVPRYNFSYYLLSAIPFGILLVTKFIEENFEKREFLLIGFAASVVLLFVFYYPLLSHLAVPLWYLTILTGSGGFAGFISSF